MDDIPSLWNLAPYPALLGILVFLTISIARGWLIPKATHEREIAIYEKQITTKDQTIERQDRQIDGLMEVGRTVQDLLVKAGPSIDESTAPGGA